MKVKVMMTAKGVLLYEAIKNTVFPSIFKNIALHACTISIQSRNYQWTTWKKGACNLSSIQWLNFLNDSWRGFLPESRWTGLESVNVGIPRCLELLIVNIKTIISKYCKENFSITQSSVDEMKIIFFLERYKKGRGTHKLMRTDQNLPGHIIAWSMWFLNSLYFFHAAAH